MLGKNCLKKVRKHVFYTHTNYVKKWGEKKRETIFPEKTPIVPAKKVGKKIVSKSAKTRFFIHTNILTKKWGKKKGETIFPDKHE